MTLCGSPFPKEHRRFSLLDCLPIEAASSPPLRLLSSQLGVTASRKGGATLYLAKPAAARPNNYREFANSLSALLGAVCHRG